MRVENGAVNSAADLYARPTSQSASDPRSALSKTVNGSDRTSLSSGSELVELAKNLMPADRLSRFQSISAAMSAGQYEADPSEVSQALVNDHLNP